MGKVDCGDEGFVVMVAKRAGMEKENSGSGRRNGGNGRCMAAGSGGKGEQRAVRGGGNV